MAFMPPCKCINNMFDISIQVATQLVSHVSGLGRGKCWNIVEHILEYSQYWIDIESIKKCTVVGKLLRTWGKDGEESLVSS